MKRTKTRLTLKAARKFTTKQLYKAAHALRSESTRLQKRASKINSMIIRRTSTIPEAPLDDKAYEEWKKLYLNPKQKRKFRVGQTVRFTPTAETAKILNRAVKIMTAIPRKPSASRQSISKQRVSGQRRATIK